MRPLLPEEMVFWEKHKNLSPPQIADAAQKAHLDHIFLAGRAKSWQKAKDKLPGWFLNKDLIWPYQHYLEQSSSEETALYKASTFPFQQVIDLTGGFGVDSWAFASKGARVVHNEPNESLSKVAEQNLKALGLTNTSFLQKDATSLLDSLNASQGNVLLYADPSRRDHIGKRSKEISQYIPNPDDLIKKSLDLGLAILLKMSPMDSIPEMLSRWPLISELHVISLKNECKEILLFINPHSTTETKIISTEISYPSEPFNYTLSDEKNAQMNVAAIDQYIYDPYVSLLKAGPYKLISSRFKVHKLHPFTHLYTSDSYVEHFPGRHFKVLHLLPAGSGQLKEVLSDHKIMIVSRNYPMSPDQLYQKLKLKTGGKDFLFAVTDHHQKRQFIIAERIH